MEHYAQTQSQNNQLDICFQAITTDDAKIEKLPSRTSREVYRIVQEVTSNILKYATGVTHIDIALVYHANRECELKITDNGKPQNNVSNSKNKTTQGIGLRTVADRAKSIGGTIEFRTMEGYNQFYLSFNSKQNE